MASVVVIGSFNVDHVRFASRYAALSTERAGAANAMPSRAEMNQRFGSL